MNTTIPATYWQRINHIVGPATAEDFDHIGQQETRDHIERFILDHADGCTRLLDAGCNTGVEGHRLFRRNFPGTYVGVDSNTRALMYALVNLHGAPASLHLADLRNIAYPDRHFDMVLTKDVIEHAEHYADILRELARLAGNYLILSMFIRLHDLPDHIYREPQGFHHNRYNRKGLYDLLADCGFSTPEIIYSAPGVRQNRFQDEVLVFRRRDGA